VIQSDGLAVNQASPCSELIRDAYYAVMLGHFLPTTLIQPHIKTTTAGQMLRTETALSDLLQCPDIVSNAKCGLG